MNDLSPRDPLSPDLAAIAGHIELLFGHLDGHVPLRLLPEQGTECRTPVNTFHRSGSGDLVPAVQKAASSAYLHSRGVFVVPGTVVQPRSAKAEDVVQSGVLLIDLDHGDIAAKLEYLTRHVGPPTLVVASGGRTPDGQDKLHVYWRLTGAAQGEDLVRLIGLRATIARKAGGDKAFDSAHQPIRVAGTIHGKNGVHSLVRILQRLPIDHELDDLAERVAEMPADPMFAEPDPEPKRGGIGLRPKELMTRRIQAGGLDVESRYSALSKVIGHWTRQVRSRLISFEEAWEMLIDYNQASIAPPWPEQRLRREFLALVRVDEAKKGPLPRSAAHPVAGEAPTAPSLSEDALAAEFVARHGAEWRHVAAWSTWLSWTGTHWSKDDTHAVREIVRQVCRAAILPDTRPTEAKRVASEKTIRAVERIASSDPVIAARVGDWDSEPFLLNTPGGVVDLDTGEVSPHRQSLMLTQLTTASPGSDCPRWRAFLGEIAGGDLLLADYLGRLCGYCLSASNQEQVFAFLYGSGANGKSVFLQTVASVLGSYAATAPMGAFMSSQNDAHPTDLAGLVGKRLVTVSETEPGRLWAETRIKTITGGDPVRARFMHRDFFEFTPTFKLVVAGNHRPGLTGVGEAIRRRMHLVPFTVTIPPARRDKQLGVRLLEEKDGILRWMLDGFARWREIGLAPPPCVIQSAEEYFDDEDLIGQWTAECCQLGPLKRGLARDLFTSWSRWAADVGAEIGSQKTFGDALRARGYTTGKMGGIRCWIGIGVRRGGPVRQDDQP
jgi:P4 family phage/plasmid primase-like protien